MLDLVGLFYRARCREAMRLGVQTILNQTASWKSLSN